MSFIHKYLDLELGMPTLFEDTNPRTLKELLDQINTREMALPDFQRDFVWDPSATQELVVSIASNYPAGSLLRIRNTQDLFASREIQGAPRLNGAKTTYLLLDGQQRLTSLYQAFFGVGDHMYYLNVAGLIDGKTFEECIYHARVGSREARPFTNPDYQFERLILPLSELRGGNGGYNNWVRRAARRLSGPGRDVLEDILDRIKDTWIQTIDDYQFPVVTLSDSTDAEAVCTIFETLNRTGVRLSPFELLTARFWPKGVNLRHLWAQALETYPLLAEFEVDPIGVLQVIGLLTVTPPSSTKGTILGFTSQTILDWWNRSAIGINNALTLLKEELGVATPRWLPYPAMLAPLAAILAKHDMIIGPRRAAIREKLIRWYWCSVFSSAYESATNTTSSMHVTEVSEWLNGGAVPGVVANFRFDSSMLRDVTYRQRSLYRGVFTMLLCLGSRDFHSNERITGKLMRDNNIDDHHVFPDNYLKSTRPEVTQRLRECVLNRTLIDRQTNLRISDKAPSAYLQEIENEIGLASLDLTLDSHLLPTGVESPLRTDDFDTFLDGRQSAITDQIFRITGHGNDLSRATFD